MSSELILNLKVITLALYGGSNLVFYRFEISIKIMCIFTPESARLLTQCQCLQLITTVLSLVLSLNLNQKRLN